VPSAPSPRNLDLDAVAGRALEFYRVMLRTRLFEEFCMKVRAAGEVMGNTYPSLGQEALGVAGLALTADDVVFPSYRSRPIYFGRGVTVAQHFRELVGGKGSVLGGREVFHHAMFLASNLLPGSSMIGGWVPVAAGTALAQQFDRAEAVPGMPEAMRHDWLTRFARDVVPLLREPAPERAKVVA
jgi:pyruvate dehydrogenase E1 component alpha subunit